MTFTGKIVGAEMCPGDRTLIHVEVAGYHPIQMSGECVLTIGAPSTPAPATGEACQHPPPHYTFPPGTKYAGRTQCEACGSLLAPAPSPVEEPARGPGRIDVADGFGFCAGLPVEDPRAKAERIIAHVKAHGGDMTTWRVEELLREAVRLLKSAPVESSTDGKGGANG